MPPPGLVTNSILFCWLFKIKDRCKKCVFYKRTTKVCISCCWRCPGTSAPSAPHLTVSLYLCSSGSNARDGDEGVAGRNGRDQCFPDEGSLICPPGKSMSFHKKETEKNWVSGQTCLLLLLIQLLALWKLLNISSTKQPTDVSTSSFAAYTVLFFVHLDLNFRGVFCLTSGRKWPNFGAKWAQLQKPAISPKFSPNLPKIKQILPIKWANMA